MFILVITEEMIKNYFRVRKLLFRIKMKQHNSKEQKLAFQRRRILILMQNYGEPL